MLKVDFDQMIKDSQLYKSLESQTKDKDRIIAEYHSLILPLHEWAHNNAAFKLGESITKRILEMAKSSVDKDKEIQALKEDHFKSLVFISDQGVNLAELREALREAVDRLDRSSKTLSMAQKEIGKTLEKCRKLIGD